MRPRLLQASRFGALWGTILCAAAGACTAQEGVPGGPAPGIAYGEQVRSALEDAASRLGLPVDRIEIVEVAPVTWADSSLGCPQPGMSYTQALVRGRRVVLRGAGQTLDYHSSASGPFFWCPADRVEPPAATGADER